MDSFIRPLLEAPNSVYHHMDLAGANKGNLTAVYNKVFGERGPLPRLALPDDDPKLRQIDTSLLVTGSLTRQEKLSFAGWAFGSSTLACQNFTNAALTNELFHAGGLVRMLLWLPESDKSLIHPHITSLRYPTSVQIAMSTQSTEVVGVEPVKNYRKTTALDISSRSRFSGLTSESAQRTARNMETIGMHTPEGREIHRVADINELPKDMPPLKSPLTIHYNTLEETNKAMDALLERWQAFKETSDMLTGAGPAQRMDLRDGFANLINTMAYPQLCDAIRENPNRTSLLLEAKKAARSEERAVLRAERAANPTKRPRRKLGREYIVKEGLKIGDERVALFADLQLTAINLEVHCITLSEQDPNADTSSLKARLIAFQDDLDASIGTRIPSRVISDMSRLWEDWFAFFTNPPALSQDRRAYEPLQASPSDFHPQSNIALMDFLPKPRDLLVPSIATRAQTAQITRELIKFLFTLRTQPVGLVLERMAPNAAQDLLPLVPALADPRKGGRLDPRHVKVRQLNEEMIEGLAKAWVEWPFQPDLWEILARSEPVNVTGLMKEPLTPEAVTDAEDD